MRLEAEAGGCTSRREGPGRPGRRTHTAFSILRHDSSATCGYTRVSGLGCGRATRERRLPASRREGLQRGWSWKLRFRVCTNASPAPHGRAASVTGARSGQASTCADHCPLHSRAAQCVCEENAHPVPTCHKSCHHTRSSRKQVHASSPIGAARGPCAVLQVRVLSHTFRMLSDPDTDTAVEPEPALEVDWTSLPNPVLLTLLQCHLGPRDLAATSATCGRWRAVADGA